ncbi:hypothetical protein TRFO_13369 [Tritrichomonas foetus]|uniref:Uncharacterized protein n=1 Tax=Tritrichomonas foetus TaxID=1144522 RepID=A0A1J4KY78_9EUKA|nr:hypothetical protein TRFO_13369 [Tritrichomonas foetus]|eukprot:OHT16209.1 hypothetical protein TRFO_13369 [Tritrichomonas foetus]
MLEILLTIAFQMTQYIHQQDKDLMMLDYYDGKNGDDIFLNISRRFSSIVIQGARNLKIKVNKERFYSRYPNFGIDLGTETGMVKISPQRSNERLTIMINAFEENCKYRITSNDPFFMITTPPNEMYCVFHAIHNEGQSFVRNTKPLKAVMIEGTKYLEPISSEDIHANFTSPVYYRSSDSFELATEYVPINIFYILNQTLTQQDVTISQLSLLKNGEIIDIVGNIQYGVHIMFFSSFLMASTILKIGILTFSVCTSTSKSDEVNLLEKNGNEGIENESTEKDDKNMNKEEEKL